MKHKNEEDERQFFLKIPSSDDNDASDNKWSPREKRVWFVTLLAGTTCCYASRTTMPLVAPETANDMKWSKTEIGSVLSAFFWGYALTQIIGGYLSDKFGAERVILAAGLGWGLITFWFHAIVENFHFGLVILCRVLLGAFQGVHFPALASISSGNLCVKDRTFFFSATTAGGAIGTLLTGTLGSLVKELFGWPMVFYAIGFLSLLWAASLKYHAMEMVDGKWRKQPVLDVSSSLLGKPAQNDQVPWLVYLKHKSLWACIICHFCQNNCFFILLSWLPTYFHDNFPLAKGWVFNVVPWMLMVPGIALANLITGRLMQNGFTVGQTRKIVEGICMITEAICLVAIGGTSDYISVVFLFTACIFAAGFHSAGVVVNPQDLAPKHSGSIFGIMNAAGAIPGRTQSYGVALGLMTLAVTASGFHKCGTTANAIDLAPKHSGSVFGLINTAASFAGFIGVYIAGYILQLTGSWASVFNVTACVNLIGISTFFVLGSGVPIVQ